MPGFRGPGSGAGCREPSLGTGRILPGLIRGAEASGYTRLQREAASRADQGLAAVRDGSPRSASCLTETRVCARQEHVLTMCSRPPRCGSFPAHRCCPRPGWAQSPAWDLSAQPPPEIRRCFPGWRVYVSTGLGHGAQSSVRHQCSCGRKAIFRCSAVKI